MHWIVLHVLRGSFLDCLLVDAIRRHESEKGKTHLSEYMTDDRF